MVEEDGQYAVTLDIEAFKMHADTLGNESPVELHEWVDVGVFADADKKDLITYEGIFVGDEKKTQTLYCDRKVCKCRPFLLQTTFLKLFTASARARVISANWPICILRCFSLS